MRILYVGCKLYMKIGLFPLSMGYTQLVSFYERNNLMTEFICANQIPLRGKWEKKLNRNKLYGVAT